MNEIPAEFWQGVEQFNQQEFYACHDTLEAIWINAPPSDKNFFQGILQVAVALHHLGNLNWRGAVILMGEGVSRLSAYPATYGEIDVEQLIDETATLLKHLQVEGAEQVSAIAYQLALIPEPPLNHRVSITNHLKLPTIKRLTV